MNIIDKDLINAKIVDIQQVENGFWKLSLETESSNDLVLYYHNKQLLFEAINNINHEISIIALADLVVDNTNNKILKSIVFDKSRVFDHHKMPILSDLVFDRYIFYKYYY
jgi:hypothetical protein